MKQLIVGLDLSFKCSGITGISLENFNAKKIQFHRVMFDDLSHKKGFNPKQIKNVQDTLYRMPTNANIGDLVFDIEDKNNFDQVEVTLKSMVAKKKVKNIIEQMLLVYKPEVIYVGIENYIMPKFNGPNNLKSVGGLITLQGMIRDAVITLAVQHNIKIKLFTPNVKSLKLFFSGKGNAEKIDMLKSFLYNYDGGKLLPGVNIAHVAYVNDVVDAFAIATYIYSKIIKNKHSDEKVLSIK